MPSGHYAYPIPNPAPIPSAKTKTPRKTAKTPAEEGGRLRQTSRTDEP